MGQSAICNCQCQEVKANFGGSHSHEEQMQTEKMLSVHHNETDCCNVPMAMFEHGLVRPRDRLPLKTDCRSLTDIDGDSIEFQEVVHAILMQPSGLESRAPHHEGGELLYPDYDHMDAEHSEVEIVLRKDIKYLAKKTANLHQKVTSHCSDLECDGGRDTQLFLQEEAASLARQVAHLAVDISSEVDKKGALQQRLAALANEIKVLAQNVSRNGVLDCPDIGSESRTKNQILFGGMVTQSQSAKKSAAFSSSKFDMEDRSGAALEAEPQPEPTGTDIKEARER